MRAEAAEQEARAAENKARDAAKSAETAQREFETRQRRSEVNLKSSTLWVLEFYLVYIPNAKIHWFTRLGKLHFLRLFYSVTRTIDLIMENRVDVVGFSLPSVVSVSPKNSFHCIKLFIYRFLGRNWTLWSWIRKPQVMCMRCTISMAKVIWWTVHILPILGRENWLWNCTVLPQQSRFTFAPLTSPNQED